MAKKNEPILTKPDTVEGTVDYRVTLIKEWSNPEGGAVKAVGTTLIVTPELYELMVAAKVVKVESETILTTLETEL